uniref:Uncharacterized protein n=1 Tax=Triticum urartu TaxID=4572 RepID=A0A8R7Q247_TRIUA
PQPPPPRRPPRLCTARRFIVVAHVLGPAIPLPHAIGYRLGSMALFHLGYLDSDVTVHAKISYIFIFGRKIKAYSGLLLQKEGSNILHLK